MPATILVVDDEPKVSALVVACLQRDGHQVVTAASGREALAQISQAVPQLILLDVRLPDTSGLELLRQLRSAHPQVGIFMMTGFDAEEVAEAATGLGALGVFSKPLDLASFRQRIQEALATGSPPSEGA